ncbi:MAG: hypothetical protein FJ202_03070 [Gemmatimonadetes bacterium]|nr:hypothetical protein [Gemmatimonadota bacterium]
MWRLFRGSEVGRATLAGMPILAALPHIGVAQAPSSLARTSAPPVAEIRLDAQSAYGAPVLAGAGIRHPAGPYWSVYYGAGVGRTTRNPAATAIRADAMMRMSLDPFRERSSALYVGGGISATWLGGVAQPTMVLIAGVELPSSGRWLRAIEIGAGNGVRAAVALRRTRPGRR